MFLLSDDGNDDDENNDDDGGGDKGHVMTQDLGSPSPRDPVQLHPLDSDSYARARGIRPDSPCPRDGSSYATQKRFADVAVARPMASPRHGPTNVAGVGQPPWHPPHPVGSVAPVAAASAGQHASEGCPSLETSSEHRGGPALRRSRQREDQRSGAVPSGRRCCFPEHADRRTAPRWVQSNARERKRREADWDRAPEKYERGV
ncbi:unnamed protein product [Lampetra planeri]